MVENKRWYEVVNWHAQRDGLNDGVDLYWLPNHTRQPWKKWGVNRHQLQQQVVDELQHWHNDKWEM